MSDVLEAYSFEALRRAAASLPPPESDLARTLVWADAHHSVAVARDPRGSLEIFVVGEPVEALDPLVAQCLEHRVWSRSSGESLPANRLVLPNAPYFDSVAAFVCSELLENGVPNDLAGGFRRSEPVIALALRRAVLSNQALVGLAGELFALGSLVEKLPEHAVRVVEGWFGSSPSSRDLQLGPVGIEIKSTTMSESVHHVQGFHQVELGVSVDHIPETRLFLLSIGLEWLALDSRVGRSIPDLVETVYRHVSDDALKQAFLDRVKQYGGDASVGYDHFAHRRSRRYGRRFQTRFERLYDLADERVHLLRSADVAHASNVDVDSIGFRVRLPAKVRGDLNPISGMAEVARQVASLLDQ